MGDYDDFHQVPAIRTGRIRTTVFLAAGTFLLLLGLVGLGVSALALSNLPNSAEMSDGWNALLIGAAGSSGVGLVLILSALITFARAARRSKL